MKRWMKDMKDLPAPATPTAQEPPPVPGPVYLKCIACSETAETMFKGTTYCFSCYHSRNRMGLA